MLSLLLWTVVSKLNLNLFYDIMMKNKAMKSAHNAHLLYIL